MRVSICTSVLNQSDFLRRNIESVRAQTFTDWEHIIVDDGSTEDIKSVVDSFHDTRLVYHRFNENKGFPAGYAKALELSKGDYVELLAADEFLWEKKLEIQVAWMDLHPKIGCTWGMPTPNVGTPWELGERPLWEQFAHFAHNRSRASWIKTLIDLKNTAIGGASMLMRRECYEAIGAFDPQFNACSDMEWFIRFFEKFDGHILNYRFADAVHPETRTSNQPGDKTLEEIGRVRALHPIPTPPMGRVTVGIPCYNMARFIGKTLDSLTKQTNQEFDIIILDDASTDDLTTAIAPYSDRIKKLFRVEENGGIAKSVNALISLCETEFFVTIAADDWLEPTYIERALKEFEADPFLEFVASQTDFVDEKGTPLAPGATDLQRIEKATNKAREQWLERLRYGNVYFGVGMYRAQALRQTGGFRSSDGVLMDYDKYLELLQRNNIRIIEEDLTHTRVHPGNASVGKFSRLWLLEKYAEIRARYYVPRLKVIIATPFYEMRGFSPYIASMVQTVQILTKHGIEHQFWELSGDSYVDRAKNTLFNKFMEDPENTDIFMIDSDMQWDPWSVLRMLMQPEEILMGSYPQKNAWEVWTAQPETVLENGHHRPVGRNLPDGSAIIKAAYISGGFIRIKRSALEKYREHFKDNFYYDPAADPGCPERKYIEYFCCERFPIGEQMMRWGEDRVFGRRLKDIDVEPWIYPNIQIGHYGIKGWTGNYDQFLRKSKEPEKANTT